MPTNKKRKPANHFAHIMPFPAFPVVSAPSMIAAPAGIYRSALVLSFAYWLSGCRPLPTDTTSLAALARVPAGNLVPSRPLLDATLAELLPMLAAEYDRQFKSQKHRIALAKYASARGLAVRRANKRSEKSHEPQIPQPISAPRLHPVQAPPHRNARVDMQARQQATERQYTAATPLDANGNATDRSNAPNVRGNAPAPIRRPAPAPPTRNGRNGMLQEPSPRRS